MTDGNTYAIDHYLLEREDYDQREENDAELFNLRCEVDVLTGMIADLHDAQTYTYIGKDGKSVLARDLEDKLQEMKAERDALKPQGN